MLTPPNAYRAQPPQVPAQDAGNAHVRLPPAPVLPAYMQQPGAPASSVPDAIQTGFNPAENQYGRMEEDGIPYRGPAVMFREKDYENYTRLGADVVSETFDTGNEQENAAYAKLIQRIHHDHGIVRSFRERWIERGKDARPRLFVYILVEFPYRELDPNKPMPRSLLRQQATTGSLDQMRAAANQR